MHPGALPEATELEAPTEAPAQLTWYAERRAQEDAADGGAASCCWSGGVAASAPEASPLDNNVHP